MEKTYNIKNIYVAKIIRKDNLFNNCFSNSDKKIGLFVKTPLGFKHILTGATYSILNKEAYEKMLKSTKICKITQYNNDIIRLVLNNIMMDKSTNRISLYHIDYLEYIINKELKKSEEKGLKV